MECPGGEQCFAQADCRGVITKKPTQHPTAAPNTGTSSPTVSPAPSMLPTEPQPTVSPLPTGAPNNDPTDGPTTPWPTFQPTYAPCQGDPCPNKEHCRSKTGYCGAGPAYCNNPSWDASCGVPTDPPVSLSPTTPWPSLFPSMSVEPSSPPPPTRTPSNSPSKAPVLDFFSPSQTNDPTKKPAEEVHPDEQYFAPDDPRGTFFCGTDWNHAIIECPTRCPNGESTECPSGWSCYAFTPCTSVGNVKPPSLKPTWEPTMKPIMKPTRTPVDPQQETTQQSADQQAGWQQPPSVKPTFKPTGERCRAEPCEDANQCRSKLGFCGVGIVYCNSESSWEPECDPDYGANGGPSQAPSTLFDSWLQKQPDVTASDVNSTSVKVPVDEVNEDKVTDETIVEEVEPVKEATYTDFTEVWGSGSQDKKETEAWWRVKSSASRAESFLLLLATFPFAALLW